MEFSSFVCGRVKGVTPASGDRLPCIFQTITGNALQIEHPEVLSVHHERVCGKGDDVWQVVNYRMLSKTMTRTW